ncbi:MULTISPECIES: glycosyltransferase [Microbacterium]|uniref:glycosyltransferase n=1 Tax=Microbacterium TaxID=33882 RepID=UPI0013A58274|nr:glycosyltransferase [Microbacterium sp. KCTC 39802]
MSRTALRLAAGEHASFGTYFGAFPAAYWFAHTRVRTVDLQLRSDAPVSVRVRATDSAGRVSTVAELHETSDACVLPVSIRADMGWIWAEVEASRAPAVVDDVGWATHEHAFTNARVTVAITTFNREADCVGVLDRLAGDVDSLGRLDAVVVADQGTRRLRDAEGFAAVAATLGERLIVVEQPNLGGSGGFSRGMLEAVDVGSSHVLLLDDDVDLETESLRRMALFAEYAPSPLIVGAQMLSLIEPTRLHSFGERILRRPFWWGPVIPELSGLDVAGDALETTPALSRRIDVDFNGWWMCLVPTSSIRSAGASLPLFIKWDDAEFGLRAAALGTRTVTLPGAALWHMPWTAKDDGLDWQAYFQLRNRVVAALLHGGRGVLKASFAQDLNHLLCAQYGSVAVRNLALHDILSGPRHLDPVLRAGPARAASVLAEHGQVVVPRTADLLTTTTPAPRRPRGTVAVLGRLVRVCVHQLRPARVDAPTAVLTRAEGKWWALGVTDAALVDAAAGNGVFVVRRDRHVARRQLGSAIVLRWRLLRGWRRLARDYATAAPQSASAAAWRQRFDDAHA